MKTTSVLLISLLFIFLSCDNTGGEGVSVKEDKNPFAEHVKTGTYVLEETDVFKELGIKYKSGDVIEITLMVATQDGCSGQFIGKAKLRDKNWATAYAEKCEAIDLRFSKDAIDVKEVACLYYHGMGCTFEGTYTRQQ